MSGYRLLFAFTLLTGLAVAQSAQGTLTISLTIEPTATVVFQHDGSRLAAEPFGAEQNELTAMLAALNEHPLPCQIRSGCIEYAFATPQRPAQTSLPLAPSGRQSARTGEPSTLPGR